jgi:hypothetical protein
MFSCFQPDKSEEPSWSCSFHYVSILAIQKREEKPAGPAAYIMFPYLLNRRVMRSKAYQFPLSFYVYLHKEEKREAS